MLGIDVPHYMYVYVPLQLMRADFSLFEHVLAALKPFLHSKDNSYATA